MFSYPRHQRCKPFPYENPVSFTPSISSQMSLAVSGFRPALLAENRNTHTHLPAWAQSTQSSLQRTLLLETSNFTDHGFGGKMSPQKQVGNYSLLESWKHQDRWVRPQTGFLASSPKELENPAPSSQPGAWWCRLGRWQRLTTGIFLTSKPFLMRLPLPGPSPSLSLDTSFITFSLNVTSLKAFPEPKLSSANTTLCFQSTFYTILSKYS